MRTRTKLMLALLAGGGTVWYLRSQDAQSDPPAAEPFMRPAPTPTDPVAVVEDPEGTAEVGAAGEDDGAAARDDGAAGGGDGVGATEPSVRATTSVRPADVPRESILGGDEPAAALPLPPRQPFASAPAGPRDDLKRISGIGPKLEAMLNEQGITTFAQLAALDDEGVDALQERLPEFPGRIRRDAWVDQAARLRDGG